MPSLLVLLLTLCCVGSELLAVHAQTASPYAPYTIACPRESLVRSARRISPEEAAYVKRRKQCADASLEAWLKKSWPSQEEVDTCDLPKLALAFSGGGQKAALTNAAIIQAFDARDSSTPVSGLLQGATYISGLSGGSVTVGSIFANNFSPVSPLYSNNYQKNFPDPFAAPTANAKDIVADVDAKANAGYITTLLDVYGRALAYNAIGGVRGGVNITWSSVASSSSFASAEAPFPLLSLADTLATQGQCSPATTNPVWEVTPYEFGSWDPAVRAFFPTRYVGTSVEKDQPVNKDKCTVNFDNAGTFVGISSNILTNNTFGLKNVANCSTDLNQLGTLIGDGFGAAEVQQNPYGIVPNPFYRSRKAGDRSTNANLYMLDGGFTGEGVPLNPWLQPSREVDVIFASDALSSDLTNVTDGSAVYNTSLSATRLGLKRMPRVPDPATFAALNLSAAPHFYGCRDRRVATIILIPNGNSAAFTASTLTIAPADIEGMFRAGGEAATQGNSTEWAGCVACGIMHKKLRGKLPEECEACLRKYCWHP